jgi:3-phosphoshikimate 1-carboxyvinyltransferase
MAAAALKNQGNLTLPGVNINPTRAGIIDVLKKMGATILIKNERILSNEPVADITVRGSELNGVKIDGAMIPLLIDELPIISVLAALAHGETIVHDAKELRNKESDRIKLIVTNLRNMGALVEEYDDGFRVIGGMPLKGCEIETNKDHRIAMAFSIAALLAEGQTIIKDAECVNISYPEFYDDLYKVRRKKNL